MAASVALKPTTDEVPDLQLVRETFRGLLADCARAHRCIERRDLHGKAAYLDRAQRFVGELATSLAFDDAPELSAQLTVVFNYIGAQLFAANAQLCTQSLDDAMVVIAELQHSLFPPAGTGA